MEIKRYGGATVNSHGLAECNNPSTELSLEQIKALRNEPINPDAFSAMIALFEERFNKKPMSDEAAMLYYRQLNQHMGNSEFLAACEALTLIQFNWQDFIPLLKEQVDMQRENGPDLLGFHIRSLPDNEPEDDDDFNFLNLGEQ